MTTTTSDRTVWRRTGTFLAATGIVHVAVFALVGRAAGADIVRAGIANAIGDHLDRALYWYGGTLLGAALILLGLFATSWVRATGRPVPRYVGWTVLGMGVGVTVLQPLSGGVLVIACGLVALSGPRQTIPAPVGR